jgi:uncharacterized protein YciU (UPF0263 family)
LGDVAGKDDHEERSHDRANHHLMSWQCDERGTKKDLHDAGDHDNEIGIEWDPGRYLRLKFGSLCGQVANTGEEECASESPSQQVCKTTKFHDRMLRL